MHMLEQLDLSAHVADIAATTYKNPVGKLLRRQGMAGLEALLTVMRKAHVWVWLGSFCEHNKGSYQGHNRAVMWDCGMVVYLETNHREVILAQRLQMPSGLRFHLHACGYTVLVGTPSDATCMQDANEVPTLDFRTPH